MGEEGNEWSKGAERVAVAVGVLVLCAQVVRELKPMYNLNTKASDAPTLLNMTWNPEVDYLQNGRPVVIPGERVATTLKAIADMSYYETQKSWVKAVMDTKKMTMATALIVKPKVRAAIAKELESVLPNGIRPKVILGDEVLHDIMDIQFYQQDPTFDQVA